MYLHSCRESLLNWRHWFHFGAAGRRCINLEWLVRLRHPFCMLGFRTGEDGWHFSFGIPPLAIFLSFEGFGLPLPMKKHIFQWDGGREVTLPEKREFNLSIHDWTLRFVPWGRDGEWRSVDPWWIRGVHLNLNPFRATHNRHEVRQANGTWVVVPECGLGEPQLAVDPEVLTLPYTYVLTGGTIQFRTAEVTVERRWRRPYCLRWTSLFEKSRASIKVDFSDEVGEETGSWKGGCTGCCYEMMPGETAEQTLRRMEREWKF